MLLASFVTVTFLGLSSRFQCLHLSVYECVLHIADGKVSPVYLCSCSLGHHYWTPIIIVYNCLYPIEAQTWGAHIVSIARWFYCCSPCYSYMVETYPAGHSPTGSSSHPGTVCARSSLGFGRQGTRTDRVRLAPEKKCEFHQEQLALIQNW
jgi:hypothetical protein